MKTGFRHPNPSLQFAWNSAQLGLLIFPLSPLLGAIGLGLALLVTWLRQYRTIIRRPLNWGFAFLSVLLIISASFANDKTSAFLGLFNFLPFFLFFAAFSVLIQTTAQLRQLSWILVLTSVPVVIMGLGQLFCGWGTIKQWESILGLAIAPGGNPQGRMASIFMYANILAGYLVIVFILALGLWLEAYQQFRRSSRRGRQPDKETGVGRRVWRQPDKNSSPSPHLPISLSPHPPLSTPVGTLRGTSATRWLPSPPLPFLFLTVATIANFVGLILTNSRNAWAIAIFACLAYALYQGWRILVAAVTSITTSVLLAAFAPEAIAQLFRKVIPAYFWARLNDQMYADRPIELMRKTQWDFAWSLAQQRPWTGWGLRNFTELYQAKMHIWLGHPHNFFLMLCAETGLPATILFCGLISWILIAGTQVLKNSKLLEKEDRLIFFSYLVVLCGWVLFNTVDVTLFDLRLNTLSWLPISAICGVVYHYDFRHRLKVKQIN